MTESNNALAASFCSVTINLETVSPRPFRTFHQALSFFRIANPARAKGLNLLEPGDRPTDFETRTGISPLDAWAAVCLAVEIGLKDSNEIERCFFKWYHLRDAPADWGVPEMAKAAHISERQARRVIKRVREPIERSLIARGLIDIPDEWSMI